MTAILDLSPREPARDGTGELAGRLAAARAEMARRGLSALLLVSPENIYYLLGLDHQGYFAFTLLVLPREGPPELVTRAMEGPTVAARAPECAHRPFHDGEDPVAVAAAAVRDHAGPGDTVGVEETAMFFPPAIWAGLRRELPDRAWVRADDLVGALREVKSGTEVDAVRRAAGLSTAALRAGVHAAAQGADQAAVAAAVYAELIGGGGQPPGFAPLIRPTRILQQEHVTWEDGPIEAGGGLLLELSGSVRRYHAPLARTVHLGHAPDEARTAHAAALAGMAAITATLRPGVLASEVYAAWADAVDRVHPQPGPPRHHCGYLVGIGFPPSWVGGGEVLGIRPGSTRVVRAGMTFHAMSWVREPAGHVLSDTVLVTPEGCEVLTGAPRDLTVV